MQGISGLTFVYNEEKTLDECLKSLRPFLSEIIIFDLESTDATFEISKKYTNKVYKMPYLLCGDSYKTDLVARSKGDWLLWFYGDEIFPEYTAKVFAKLTEVQSWDAYAFMRHEYMDNIRLNFMGEQGNKIEYGSTLCPNYQIRLIKKSDDIYYTELVHAEIHGKYKTCNLPPEYYIDHKKTSSDQEFDNIRIYIWCKFLIYKYGNTSVQPFKRYIDSYKKMIIDSEAKNLIGERRISLAEEFWYEWRKFAKNVCISVKDFEKAIGIPYEKFIQTKEDSNIQTIDLPKDAIDRAVKETNVEEK